MKKLTVILLFTSIFSYAQIDYNGLVKNLEEVTIDTDVKEYLKGLPFDDDYSDIEFKDERFLRFYGIIMDKVKFVNRGGRKRIYITPFNEKEDYDKMKAKLIEIYGEPEINDRGSLIEYEWETDAKEISLEIKIEEKVFKELKKLTISFKEQ